MHPGKSIKDQLKKRDELMKGKLMILSRCTVKLSILTHSSNLLHSDFELVVSCCPDLVRISF